MNKGVAGAKPPLWFNSPLPEEEELGVRVLNA
jgi:hypothetical protein